MNKAFFYDDDYLADLLDEMGDTNSLNSLAPIQAYLIIKSKTSKTRHMTQAKLREYLSHSVIEIENERGAISRMIQTLCRMNYGICIDENGSVYYDATKEIIVNYDNFKAA